MTIATLLVNVQANTAQLVTGVESVNSQLNSMMSTASKVAGVFGIAFGAQAVIGFGKAILDDADLLMKLHDKTDLSLQALQRFRIAGDDAGVSLDSMATAVNKLQKNIGSDNDGATGALATLGLHMEDIRALSPERQFYDIAAAIKEVHDPAQQVAIAVALFGKAGAEMLPVIKRGFDDVKNSSVGMSDETVANLDAVGDGWTAMVRTAKGAIANLIMDIAKPDPYGLRALERSLNDVKTAAEKLKPHIDKVMPLEVVVNVREFDREMADSTTHINAAQAALKAHNDALDKVNQKILDATRDTGSLTAAQDALILHYKDLGLSNADIALKMGISENAIKKLESAVTFASKATSTLYNTFGTLASIMPDLSGRTAAFREELDTLASSSNDFSGGMSVAGDVLDHTVIPAFTTLPNVVAGGTSEIQKATTATALAKDEMWLYGQAINDLASGDIPSMIHGLMTLRSSWKDLNSEQKSAAIGAGVIGGLSVAESMTDPNKKSGQVVGYASKGAQIGMSFGGGYGALVGMGVGAIVGALKVSPEEIAARQSYADWQTKIIAQFDQMSTGHQRMEAHGQDWAKVNILVRDAYEDVGKTGDQAMHDLSIALDATHHSASDVEKALANINGVLDEQKKDAADLDSAIQKYGFSIEELGPKMQRQKLTDQAVTLMNDFRLLAGSGIDVGTVLDKMGGSINDFIATALRTGTEVPDSMKPMLQKMVDMGTLVDQNGDKITDLGTSGLTFSQTMTQGFDRIVSKFDELLTKLGLIPAAVAKIPTDIDVKVHGTYYPPDLTSGGVTQNTDNPADLGFASGTHGRFLDFGSGTRVTLHGRERVSTEGEGRAEGSAIDRLLASQQRRDVFLKEIIVSAVKAAVRQRAA